MKKLLQVKTTKEQHWVGDGFFVKTIFTYNDLAAKISPFLLMDYGGLTEFKPTDQIRGVGEHPHRGFETVTIVYSGEVEHRDSAGGGGLIREGDIQWMTAASGLVHEEKHSQAFARQGGPFEMVQLWVNLPKKDKMSKPRYQGIRSTETPILQLENQAGTLRIISGQYQQKLGPAKTFTPINLWDLRLNEKKSIQLKVPEGHTTTLFVLSGKLKIKSGEILNAADLAIFESTGGQLEFEVIEKAKVLFMGGEPIHEPIVGYGPFVMNTENEIRQAFIDFQNGLMGQIDPVPGSE